MWEKVDFDWDSEEHVVRVFKPLAEHKSSFEIKGPFPFPSVHRPEIAFRPGIPYGIRVIIALERALSGHSGQILLDICCRARYFSV